ncbi:hypothetical protein [uncultured Dechloromonas sp.]|uniref:hypothetical protein n=1 Tax=uncultured Dechloromonas sp. TaxID=171719 RepID=UPI0025CC3D12|nr:hypothetical protein [uncultured Dechloromonas sp.]
MKTKTVPGFEKVTGRPPLVVWHTFEVTKDGQMAHLIDGVLRATVPPEGWLAYCDTYPDAQDIVDELTKPTEIPPPAPEPTMGQALTIQEQLAAALATVQQLQQAVQEQQPLQ